MYNNQFKKSIAKTQALANGKYSNSHRLVYLQGSVMNPADLARAAVPKAKAVFILADKMSFRPQLDDSKTIIYLLAVGHAIQVMKCNKYKCVHARTHTHACAPVVRERKSVCESPARGCRCVQPLTALRVLWQMRDVL